MSQVIALLIRVDIIDVAVKHTRTTNVLLMLDWAKTRRYGKSSQPQYRYWCDTLTDPELVLARHLETDLGTYP